MKGTEMKGVYGANWVSLNTAYHRIAKKMSKVFVWVKWIAIGLNHEKVFKLF